MAETERVAAALESLHTKVEEIGRTLGSLDQEGILANLSDVRFELSDIMRSLNKIEETLKDANTDARDVLRGGWGVLDDRFEGIQDRLGAGISLGLIIFATLIVILGTLRRWF